MPWTAAEFRRKHNRKLSDMKAKRAASIASAMVSAGVDEGIAVATANKRVMGPQERHRVAMGKLVKRRGAR